MTITRDYQSAQETQAEEGVKRLSEELTSLHRKQDRLQRIAENKHRELQAAKATLEYARKAKGDRQ